MSRISVLRILFAALFVSCSKEEITSRPYPRTTTVGVTAIANGAAHFKGEVIFTSVAIIDHGFVWSNTGIPSITNGQKKSLGVRSGTGIFEVTADQLLIGAQYTVRAYAQSSDYVVYGEDKSFVSK